MITKKFDLEDVFLMSEIIEKMDLNIAIDKYMNAEKVLGIKKDNKEKTEEEIYVENEEVGKKMLLKVGVDIGMLFLKRMHKAHKEIKKLIANLTGKTMVEVSQMNLKDLTQFFKELVKEEDFKDFLSQAGE